MKSLKSTLLESNNTFETSPEGKIVVYSKKELNKAIDQMWSKFGNDCNLNNIDTSHITDMSRLFADCFFNGDISEWDVSNVTNMSHMFDGNSKFNGDLSKWDVSKVENMSYMFSNTKFNGDISKWNMKNVSDAYAMFLMSEFNQDISNWNIDKTCDIRQMFDYCPIKDEFKPKSLEI